MVDELLVAQLQGAATTIKMHTDKIITALNYAKSSAEIFIDDDAFWESLYVNYIWTNHFNIGASGLSLNISMRVVNKAKIEVEITNSQGVRVGLMFIRRA